VNLPTIPWCVHKGLFRACLREVLPPEVRERPKAVLRGHPIRAKLSRNRERWEKNYFPEPEIAHFVDTAVVPMLESLSIGETNWAGFFPYSLSLWLKVQKMKVVNYATPRRPEPHAATDSLTAGRENSV
jgi:hypothetical protein